MELMESLPEMFKTDQYRLLVIDSVMANYRRDYQGRGELSERQQHLGSFLAKATRLSEEFNIAVLMVCSRHL